MQRATWIRLGILAILVTLIVVVFVVVPLKEYHERFVRHIDALGIWGPCAIVLVFVLACLFMIPVTPIALAAGMLFKFWLGLGTVIVGSLLGPALTFFVGKLLGRAWIARALARNKALQAIDRAVAEQGFKIIVLARLSPFVPFGVMNYMFSLSRVRFVMFISATILGVLPTTVAYAYLGSLANNLDELIEEQRKGGIVQGLIFWGGLAATIAVSVIITIVAKRALSKALGPAAQNVPVTLPEVVKAVAEAVAAKPEAGDGKPQSGEAVVE